MARRHRPAAAGTASADVTRGTIRSGTCGGTLADRAETELRATGAKPRRAVLTGLEVLTASERRIAELAAQGLTNRQIAQNLFVTARTVEGHLTQVFHKLDIAARTELPAALGRSPWSRARLMICNQSRRQNDRSWIRRQRMAAANGPARWGLCPAAP